MGMHGAIVFYSEAVLRQPENSFMKVFGTFGPGTKVCMAGQHRGSEWSSFRKITSGSCNRIDIESEMSQVAAIKLVRDPRTLAEVVALFSDDIYVHIYVSHDGQLARRMISAVSAIPENVRDGFTPWEPIITIGRHDIFESFENEQGQLFAHANISIRFDSSGIPHDIDEYRRQVTNSSEINHIREEFETILGPLDQCVYWEG